jgi:cell division protein FtsX
MTGLRAFWYAMARAMDGLRRTPAVAMAVTGAVAVGFLLVGVVHLLAHNIEAMAQTWGGGAHMVVYLEAGTPADDAEKLRAALDSMPAVARGCGARSATIRISTISTSWSKASWGPRSCPRRSR